MIANEPQTLRDQYSRATNILDAKYMPASLDASTQNITPKM
jgi:hypothetical protein